MPYVPQVCRCQAEEGSMKSTPFGCDTLWEIDPLPLKVPARPAKGEPDVEWHRLNSKAILEEDAIERSRRLRCPVQP